MNAQNGSMLVGFAEIVVDAYATGQTFLRWGYGEDDGGRELTWADANETDAILLYRELTGR